MTNRFRLIKNVSFLTYNNSVVHRRGCINIINDEKMNQTVPRPVRT